MSDVFPNSPAHLVSMRKWSSSLVCLGALEVEDGSGGGAGGAGAGSIWDSITENNLSRFDNLINKLINEAQISTRRYIEFTITRVLALNNGIKIPLFIGKYFSISNYYKTSISAGLIISYMQILMDILLQHKQLDQSIIMLMFNEVQPWLLYNNHLVRARAMSFFLTIYKMLPNAHGSDDDGPSLMGLFLENGKDNKKFIQKYNNNNSLSPLSPLTMEVIFELLPSTIANFPTKEIINSSLFLPLKIPIHSHYPRESLPSLSPQSSPISLLGTTTPPPSPPPTFIQIKPTQISSPPPSTFYGKGKSTFKLIIIASLLERTQNIAGLTRTSEVMGIESLMIPKLSMIESEEFCRISMSSEKWCPFQECSIEDLKSKILSLREDYRIVGLEQTSSSIPLSKASLFSSSSSSIGKRGICLLLGNERHGIPAEYLHLVDECIEIPQWGVIRSMNVHVSASILIWEARRQWLLLEEKNLLLTNKD